ncbi:MAG: septum formation protein Maf [Sedimentisphaerales bacterium]|nr:septum formation protein Maf [Sedimentisphaerales bacterium]
MNNKYDHHEPFILASASPRRRSLLEKAGYTFEAVVSQIEESTFDIGNMTAEEYACRLSLAKAKAVAIQHPNRLVIGADTVVDFDGDIIGKPRNADDAEQITRRLFSKPHKVITGLAMVWQEKEKQIICSDCTVVYPRPMDEQQIVEHIQGQTWQGKAGAYAIQETGDQFIERIEGSFSNVVGLPMELLARMLKQIGYSQ